MNALELEALKERESFDRRLCCLLMNKPEQLNTQEQELCRQLEAYLKSEVDPVFVEFLSALQRGKCRVPRRAYDGDFYRGRKIFNSPASLDTLMRDFLEKYFSKISNGQDDELDKRKLRQASTQGVCTLLEKIRRSKIPHLLDKNRR